MNASRITFSTGHRKNSVAIVTSGASHVTCCGTANARAAALAAVPRGLSLPVGDGHQFPLNSS